MQAASRTATAPGRTRQGTEIAYRVLGGDPDGKEDRDISARDLFRVARPRFYSEGRTAPELSAAVLDFFALHEAQTAQLDQQTTDAKLTIVEERTVGPDLGAESIKSGLIAMGVGTGLVVLLAALLGLAWVGLCAMRGMQMRRTSAIAFGPCLAAAIWIVRLLQSL